MTLLIENNYIFLKLIVFNNKNKINFREVKGLLSRFILFNQKSNLGKQNRLIKKIKIIIRKSDKGKSFNKVKIKLYTKSTFLPGKVEIIHFN